jgi:hypothetical protein
MRCLLVEGFAAYSQKLTLLYPSSSNQPELLTCSNVLGNDRIIFSLETESIP